MVARKQTNLTPAQLEEFESVFRHFDENATNTLDLNEFGAALSALGFNYADAETEDIHARLSDEEGAVSFEAYLKFLVCLARLFGHALLTNVMIDPSQKVDVCEDTFSPDQILGSCQSIADGKSYITTRDLELAKVPADIRDFLSSAMPRSTDASEGEEGLDFQTYLQNIYGL